jgi:hypothetical protein
VTVLPRDMSLALLKAMGCPAELCQSVRIDMQLNELVAVEIRYSLDPAWLEAAGKMLKKSLE